VCVNLILMQIPLLHLKTSRFRHSITGALTAAIGYENLQSVRQSVWHVSVEADTDRSLVHSRSPPYKYSYQKY